MKPAVRTTIKTKRNMEFTAEQIASFLNGKIEGDPKVRVSGVSGIDEGRKGTLSFLANPKYEKYLYTTEASIVLVNKELKLRESVGATLIRVDNAYQGFASLMEMYDKAVSRPSGVSRLSSIDSTAAIGKDLYIGDFTVVSKNARIGDGVRLYPQVYVGEGVEIGDNSVLYPGVKVYRECRIGKDCIIHAGTIIGSDGFGFVPQEGSEYKKIPQLGNVIIEDDVELGSNVSIDRATTGSTVLQRGVKVDNLVQIAHNVVVGENTVIVAQAGIAGSAKIGARCMIGGQVGIVGHLTIADEVKIGAQSGVTNNIKEEGAILLGSPTQKIGDNKRSLAVFKNLPEMYRTVHSLVKEIESLKEDRRKSETS